MTDALGFKFAAGDDVLVRSTGKIARVIGMEIRPELRGDNRVRSTRSVRIEIATSLGRIELDVEESDLDRASTTNNDSNAGTAHEHGDND
jgi:hypothetical protein